MMAKLEVLKAIITVGLARCSARQTDAYLTLGWGRLPGLSVEGTIFYAINM